MKLPGPSRLTSLFFHNTAAPRLRFALPVMITIAMAATADGQITLTQGDALNQSSWAFGGRWSDGEAPSAAKDYVNNVSGRLLRSPHDGQSTVFAGGSLTISNGAILIHKGTSGSTITIFDLRLDTGGTISVVDAGRTLTVDGNILVQNGGGVFRSNQNPNTNLVIASKVTGSGPLAKVGPGTVLLNGDFTEYTGTLSVNEGAARFNAPFNGDVILNAGGRLAGESAIAGNLTLNGGGILIDAQSAGSLSVAGNLNLTGINSIDITENPPTDEQPFPLISYGGTLTGDSSNLTLLGSYRDVQFDTATPGVISLSVGREETRTWTGAAGQAWDINNSPNWLEGDQLYYQLDSVVFGDQGAGDVAITGVLTPSSITVNSTVDYRFTAEAGNRIAGPASLTKNGTGTLTLQGANTFTGGIAVNSGVLRGEGVNPVFGGVGQVITIADGATLDINSSIAANRDYQVFASGSGVDGAGAIVSNGDVNRTYGVGKLTLTGDTTVGGLVTWDVRPISAGNGLLDLAGHTLTKIGFNNINIADAMTLEEGDIIINEGSLTFSRGDVAGAGQITVNDLAALRLINFTSGSFSKAIHLNNGRLENGGADFALDSDITFTGTGTLDASSNTLTIRNPVSGTGDLVKTGGGTVVLETTPTYDGATSITSGTLAFGAQTPADLPSGPIFNDGTLVINRGDSAVVDTDISGFGGLNIGQGGGNPDAVITLTGDNTFGGNVRVFSGALRIQDAAALGQGFKTIAVLNRNAGLQLDGSAGNIVLPPDFRIVGSNDVPEFPVIENLAGDNVVAGDIDAEIGGGGPAFSVSGGSLTLAGNITNLSTQRPIVLGGDGGPGIITGQLLDGANPLGIHKRGSNTWTLANDNFQSANTTIFAGVLQVGDGGEFGSLGSGNVINDGSLVFNRSLPGGFTEIEVNNLISGSGSLAHVGPARTVLTQQNTYTGDTLVSAGTLAIQFPSLDDGSAVRLSGTGALDLAHGQPDTVRSLFIDGEPQTAGTWGGTGSGAEFETPLITGGGLLIVTTSGDTGTPFESWAEQSGLTAANSAPGDDPDNDGVTNLAEFAFDGDPLSGADQGKSDVRIATVDGVPALTLTLPVRTAVGAFTGSPVLTASGDGLTYRIEGSPDLTSWTLPVTEVTGPDAAAIQAGLPALSDAGWTYRTFRTPGPAMDGSSEFIRAGVEE